MINLRKASERGHANHGWLDTYHTFSFADYFDRHFMNFRVLRVINEDKVAAGQGFGTHPHDNMEILTYVLKGSLKHQDSMGNGSIIKANDFQLMSAGTGITHSEVNPSSSEEVHLYQIWIMPEQKGLTPRYEQKSKKDFPIKNNLSLIASKNGDDNSLRIRQDLKLYLSNLNSGENLNYKLNPNRYLWVQVVKGSIKLNDLELNVSDAAAISEEKEISLTATSPDTEVMLFDLS